MSGGVISCGFVMKKERGIIAIIDGSINFVIIMSDDEVLIRNDRLQSFASTTAFH